MVEHRQCDRRGVLRLVRSGLVLSAASAFTPFAAPAAPRRQPVALLLPLTGASASLGISMQRAAELAQAPGARADELIVLDTGGTPVGAAAAAAEAMKRRALMVLGPLFTAEVAPVVAAVAGKVPILAFSNDAALRESGAYLLGITASQATSAILRYARNRGVRRVGVVAGTGGWAQQAAATAQRMAGELGLELTALAAPAEAQAGTLVPAFTRAGGGTLPDAVLLPAGGGQAIAIARALKGSGTQLLATFQTADDSPAAREALDGAWISAPDPDTMSTFSRGYQSRHGGAPGTIAALAYDAAIVANTLRKAGQLNRTGLLGTASFPGATGAIRFRSDGTAMRRLAIVVGGTGGMTAVDRIVAV